jgi:hypothetical protein
LAGRRVFQGQECHSDCPVVFWKEIEFYRAAFLDPRVFPRIGMTEETIREYIKAPQKEDRQLDQKNLFKE